MTTCNRFRARIKRHIKVLRKSVAGIVIGFALVGPSTAQISPPGMGKTKTGSWFALAIRQALDSANHKQIVCYAGYGLKSNPNHYSPVYKPFTWIFNQEFYNQFRPNWQYAAALSYRRQYEYQSVPPFEKATPSIRQEYRIYGRFSYVRSSPRFRFTQTFRQEFRRFYFDDFSNPAETMQLRSRFRSQVTWFIHNHQTHRIVAGSEALFASSLQTNWSALKFTEIRTCLYYAFAPRGGPLVFNIGYMNNLIQSDKLQVAHYLALDIILENPFTRRNSRALPAEYLE